LIVLYESGDVVTYSLDGQARHETLVHPEYGYASYLTTGTDEWLYFEDRGEIHRLRMRPPWSDRPEVLPIDIDCIEGMVEAPDGRLYVLAACRHSPDDWRIEVVTGPPWSSQVLTVINRADHRAHQLVLDAAADRLYYVLWGDSRSGVWSLDRFTGSDRRLEFTSVELGGIYTQTIGLYSKAQQMYVWNWGKLYSVDLLADPGAHRATLIGSMGGYVQNMAVNPDTGDFCMFDSAIVRALACWKLDDLEYPSRIDAYAYTMTLTADGRRLVYAKSDTIESAQVDGTEHQTLLAPSIKYAYGVGVDPMRQRVYLSRSLGERITSGISYADLAGDRIENVFSFPQADGVRYDPSVLVVDASRRRIFVQVYVHRPNTPTDSALYGMDLNGRRAEVLATGVDSTIALDELTGRVCWCGESDIRCDDGQSPTGVPIVDTSDRPFLVGIDSTRRIVYWYQRVPVSGTYEYHLYRADIDTGESQRDITPVDLPGPLLPNATAVDSVTGRVYVEDWEPHIVWSVDQDGRDFEVVLDRDDGLEYIMQMTIVRDLPPGRDVLNTKDRRTTTFRR